MNVLGVDKQLTTLSLCVPIEEMVRKVNAK